MLRTAVAGLVFTVSISVAQNWTTLPAGAAPPISGHAAMAFDVLRGRLVCVVDELLDYSTGPGALARVTTWEWDGSAWWQRHPAHSPAGSDRDLAIAWHPLLQRMVMVNGSGDTWTYDGFDWQQLPTPSVWVYSPSLAYDAARNVLVMVSDSTTYDLVNGAWVTSPSTQPTGPWGAILHGARIAFHAPSNRIVLFGGYGSSQAYGVTWTRNGVTWTQMAPATVPLPRYNHQLIADPLTGNIVMMGGCGFNAGQQYGDVFEWNGVDWSPATPMPELRSCHAAAAFGSFLAVFGGWVPQQQPIMRSADVLLRAGGTWITLPTLHGGEFAVHDTLRARTVSVDRGRTLEFDGCAWSDRAPAPFVPTLLAFHAAAGHTVALDEAGLTWLWNGAQWTQSRGSSPPPRTGAGATYDPVRARVVVAGGIVGFTYQADVWEWDGSAWSNPTQSGVAPIARTCKLVWNPLSQKCLRMNHSYGTAMNVAYEWDGAAWSTLPATTPSLTDPQLATDPVLGVVMLGQGPTPNPWSNVFGVAYQWTGTSWQSLPAPDVHGTAGPVVFDTNRGTLIVHDHTLLQTYVRPVIAATAQIYGTACSGSAGTPRIAASSLPQLGARSIVDVDRVAANSIAVLFGDFVAASIPVPGGCTVLVPNPIVIDVAPTTAAGFATLDLQLPPSNTFLGFMLYEQVLTLDPQGAFGALGSLTAGLQLRLGN